MTTRFPIFRLQSKDFPELFLDRNMKTVSVQEAATFNIFELEEFLNNEHVDPDRWAVQKGAFNFIDRTDISISEEDDNNEIE